MDEKQSGGAAEERERSRAAVRKPEVRGDQIRSNTPAAPIPVPMHMLIIP
jgi:hypothetical protein